MLEKSASCLRVFLSADLAGSTKLKNRFNHQELLDKYLTRKALINTLIKRDANIKISKEIETATVISSLGVSKEDFDWAAIVELFYEGIHSEFVAAIENLGSTQNKPKPWKAVGDELIYQIEVTGRKHLHDIVVAFLQALRKMDKKLTTLPNNRDTGLRLKGTAWVAGFPVRNREIKVPESEQPDFLGPDIDTGFRLGKCSRAGMLVVSVELAELLGEVPGEFTRLSGTIVGWELLKGVWNDQRYPVIWVDFPESLTNSERLSARPFDFWEQEECHWCKEWEKAKGTDKNKGITPHIASLLDDLKKLREGLPQSLGVVDPYITGDKIGDPIVNDGPPDTHKEILALLNEIDDQQMKNQKLDSDISETNNSARKLNEDVQKVQSSLANPPTQSEAPRIAT